MKSVGSYSFYSKELNKNKYDVFLKKAIAIREFKNRLSELISSELVNFLDLSKFDIVKRFGTQKDNPLTLDSCLRGNEIQKAVVDVMTAYENRFNQVRSKIFFSVQKTLKVTYYKRKAGLNKKGDVKTFELKFKSTKLSKILTYLAKYGYYGILENLKTKELGDSDKDKFLKDVIFYLEKFGEDRLMRLCLSKRLYVINKYNKPIEFKTLSYRSAIQSNDPLLQNNKGFTNAYIIIPSFNGSGTRKIVVPVNFSINHHGHLNQYKSKEFIVVVENDRVRFITTKNVKRNFAVNKENFIGVDVNLKHNLFSTSINETINYDKKEFTNYIKFLKKTDKKNTTKGEDKQFNLWQLRIQNMLKRKCSELIDLAVKNGKDHIVMEDLKLLGKSFIKSNDFENFKFSRLVRLLNLSSLNKIVASICEKKGIQLTIIHSHYTSQMCSKCGCISRDNRKTQELFECVSCQDTRNADYNASINICLIGRQEVLDPIMLIKSESSWWIPKPYIKKEVLKIHLEDIIAESAFQQRRENLLRLANSS